MAHRAVQSLVGFAAWSIEVIDHCRPMIDFVASQPAG
jgi:hypothetical protein